MKVGIHEAKTNLSKLIPLVLSGEEIIITKAGHPLVKLVPFQETTGKRHLGQYKGKVKFNYDLLEPLPEDVIADFWPEVEDP